MSGQQGRGRRNSGGGGHGWGGAMGGIVTAEEPHMVVVTILQRPRLVDILAYQSKSHITLDHLL